MCSGCTAFPNREKPAKALADLFRDVTGVDYVDPGYHNSMTSGAYFQVRVDVKRSVDAQALSETAGKFAAGVDAVGFPEHGVELWISYYDYPNVDPDDSRAVFDLTDAWKKRNPVTSADVASAVALWANVLQFPGVQNVSVFQPTDEYETGRDRGVHAGVVDQAAGLALQKRFPELTNHWEVVSAGRS